MIEKEHELSFLDENSSKLDRHNYKTDRLGLIGTMEKWEQMESLIFQDQFMLSKSQIDAIAHEKVTKLRNDAKERENKREASKAEQDSQF